jgi:hypothetical protein
VTRILLRTLGLTLALLGTAALSQVPDQNHLEQLGWFIPILLGALVFVVNEGEAQRGE